jgi:alkanesulfonate monooxygenase SsuD/methylene tetrahydromethanopterin reductase-like flavin-dependent oxidoreductase (luciferase family)
VIRSTPEAAHRAYLELLERNRTPVARMDGDVSVWVGTPEQIAETILDYRRVGFHTFVAELPAPYDEETMASLIEVVKPMVEREGVPT